MILHIPHSSFHIPPEVRGSISLGAEDLNQELIRMTDAFTEELFDLDEPHHKVVYPVSRIVCDPERFLDDKTEPMSKVGMGVVYTHTSDGHILRPDLSDVERQKLIDRFYLPHHRRLEKAVVAELAKDGRSLIIDCHSFPSKPLPYEFDQSADRPDICIGTDDFHTPDWLINATREILDKYGLDVAQNRPFEGTIVPTKHFQKNFDVTSVMIEINRKLYMDESTGNRSTDFAECAGTLQRCLKEIFKKILNQIAR